MATNPTFDIDTFTKNARIEENGDIGDDRTFKVVGEGNFDKLMETARKHLDALYMSNAIRKEDYATIYTELFKTGLQIVLLAEEKGYDNALKKRQIQGFNEAFKKDILKIMVDGWTVGFSASEETFYDEDSVEKIIPNPLKGPTINSLWENIEKEVDEPISYTREETLSA